MTDSEKAQKLADAAKRALAEAEARKSKAAKSELPTELGGRDGPEPTRFGDWEKKGITSDF
ncbi:DUF1674 domain-containing protein [Amylibacter sp. IMCC11727]|uniref:DUF1674 domain-containing protein n=1 Tax=Amylibacter sp. IMCC11727 TaxID=3039851 RepID=UPI00244E52BB|nr:DUF1674 domain-containing protein [Amylibacter sp. IMCC11727]WGI22596.1 DUF1674 domain-containing protein [Amylibacter sp. IMCC11727]